MKVCAEAGCPVLTTGTRCVPHTRARDRARGTSTKRGYDSTHKRVSTELRAQAIGSLCHFCRKPMTADQSLALDHTEDRTGYRGVAHLSCNAADGARRRGHA